MTYGLHVLRVCVVRRGAEPYPTRYAYCDGHRHFAVGRVSFPLSSSWMVVCGGETRTLR